MGAPGVDVLVVGGGPAGATAAALLASGGHAVRVLDKARFPRFHVGESLLPENLRAFERVGLSLEGGPFLRKLGAEFIDETGGRRAAYPFAGGLPGTGDHAFNVDRAALDAALLNRARAAGVEVREERRVVDVAFEDDGVTARLEDGSTERARYLVDATGQDALLARRKRAVEPIRGFGKAAVFCHFDGVRNEVAHELSSDGNVRILLVDEGWLWVIPLSGERLSVGLVSAKTGVRPALLEAALARSPLLGHSIAGATPTVPRVLRNFSYQSRASRGPRWAAIGDAAAFLDPVFSSGITLALAGAVKLAALLDPALNAGREADPHLAAPLSAHMGRAYETFAILIHSFYNMRLVDHFLFHDDPAPDIRAGLVSILAGDVFRDDNPMQRMLLASKRSPPLPRRGVSLPAVPAEALRRPFRVAAATTLRGAEDYDAHVEGRVDVGELALHEREDSLGLHATRAGPITGKASERKPAPSATPIALRVERRIDASEARQSMSMPATWTMPRNGRRPAPVSTASPSRMGPAFATSRKGASPPRRLMAPDTPWGRSNHHGMMLRFQALTMASTSWSSRIPLHNRRLHHAASVAGRAVRGRPQSGRRARVRMVRS